MQAQEPLRTHASLEHLGFGLIHFRQDAPRPHVKSLALGGKVQAPRCSLQQARTEPILETGHQLGECRGRQTHLARSRREPAGIDGADKGGHFCRTVHAANYGINFTNVVPQYRIVMLIEGYYSSSVPCCTELNGGNVDREHH